MSWYSEVDLLLLEVVVVAVAAVVAVPTKFHQHKSRRACHGWIEDESHVLLPH